MLTNIIQNKETHQLYVELEWLPITQQYRVRLVRKSLDQDPSHMEFYLTENELLQFRAGLEACYA